VVWSDAESGGAIGASVLRPAGETAPVDGGVDVLFAGAVTERRRVTLRPLQGVEGLTGEWVTDTFGAELAARVDRATLVLSVSSFGARGESKLPRVLPLLARGAVVVSERDAAEGRADAGLIEAGAIIPARRECIAAVVMAALADPSVRLGAANAARRAFSVRSDSNS